MSGKVLLSSVVLLCLLDAAGAAQRGRQRVRCGRVDSTGEAGICAYFAYKKADAEMDRMYRQLVSQLSGSGNTGAREKLRKAQSLWLGYRDATCDSEASRVAGGSLHPPVRYSCLASVTRERTKRLKAYLSEMQNL